MAKGGWEPDSHLAACKPGHRANAEQRLWRTVTRRKYQLTRNRVQLESRLECLLEEAHIKLSSLVSDLLGPSARRMLQAVADGETCPATLAGLAHQRMRATPDQLCDALGACTDLHPVYRQLLRLTLEELPRGDDRDSLSSEYRNVDPSSRPEGANTGASIDSGRMGLYTEPTLQKEGLPIMKRMMQRRFLCYLAWILLATPLAAQTGQIFVTNKAGTTVSVIDVATNKVVQTIGGIEVPEAARFSPDGKWVYVSQSAEDFLNVVERETGTIVKRIPLSGYANDLAVTPDGKLVLVCIATTPGYVDVIDAASMTKIKSIPMQARMHDIIVTGDGKWAIGGSPAGQFAAFFDLETLELHDMMEFDMGVMPLAIENNSDGSGNRLYLQLNRLNGFAVIDFKNRKEITRIEHPKEPNSFGAGGAPSHGMAVAPDNKSIWVASRPANAIFAYSIPDFKLLGRVDLPQLNLPGQAPRGTRPNWVTLSPDSKTVYVANRGMRSVTAIDAETMQTVAVIPVGEAPDRVSTLVLP